MYGLVIIENSDWIQSLVGNFVLSESYADDAFGSEMNDVMHYRIYFDEVGLYEVVCKKMQIVMR